MPAAGIAGDLDDDLDIVAADRLGTVLGEIAGRDAVLVPADVAAGGLRPLGIEVGDDVDPEARRGRRLGEEHGAEFAGTDDGDADRSLSSGTFGGEAGEIHGEDP